MPGNKIEVPFSLLSSDEVGKVAFGARLGKPGVQEALAYGMKCFSQGMVDSDLILIYQGLFIGQLGAGVFGLDLRDFDWNQPPQVGPQELRQLDLIDTFSNLLFDAKLSQALVAAEPFSWLSGMAVDQRGLPCDPEIGMLLLPVREIVETIKTGNLAEETIYASQVIADLVSTMVTVFRQGDREQTMRQSLLITETVDRLERHRWAFKSRTGRLIFNLLHPEAIL